jgi:transcriptional regulator with XRE-family HTH domain
MTSTFGSRLRAQRERQEISLSAIAEKTKIKLSLLEALERDDLSHWPLGLFGRSYIRSYAQAVGLEPDATVREFLTAHPGSVEPVPDVIAEVKDLSLDKQGRRRPPTRLEVLIESAIDAFHARRNDVASRQQHQVSTSSEQAPLAYAEPTSPRRRTPLPQDPPDLGSLDDDLLVDEPDAPMPMPVVASLGFVDLSAVAELCTRLCCAQQAHEVTTALEEAADILGAVGLILWIPDSLGVSLTPVFAHGYAEEVVSHLGRLSIEANNASADAFRTHLICTVPGNEMRTGALVAPLLTPMGCAGVLAVELRNGAEQREDVRASLTILTAQLATLMGVSVLAQHTMSA